MQQKLWEPNKIANSLPKTQKRVSYYSEALNWGYAPLNLLYISIGIVSQ